ncbi:MAG TPA: helix-turn-helix transcriptional regulator [Thermoanaerobaculia bacterium]|nr:helix-turn-helix transcriptional regulator [Thermoanaerobaculia bacterium]
MIHRHLDIPGELSVRELPLAALHDLLERGDLDDWRPLLREIEERPNGEVAKEVARLIDAYPMYGTSPLLRGWLERCRHRLLPSRREPYEVLSLAGLRRALGRTQADVARSLGISQSDYSKLERRKDVRVSTLRSVATALGGVLRLAIDLPQRSVEAQIGSADETAQNRGS